MTPKLEECPKCGHTFDQKEYDLQYCGGDNCGYSGLGLYPAEDAPPEKLDYEDLLKIIRDALFEQANKNPYQPDSWAEACSVLKAIMPYLKTTREKTE
jgi:hypothetical protein